MIISHARNIDEVINSLELYIDDCIYTQNRMGYFATLYCSVTKEVRKGIQNNRFENAKRMESLDVHFANLFFEATATPSLIWKTAFTGAKSDKYVLLQHLLLGMNAHINYDLAFAVKKSVTKDEMLDLFKDYDEINNILIEQIDLMQDKINKSWWAYKVLDLLALKFDEKLVGFSLIKARESAWHFAQGLQEPSTLEQTKKEVLDLSLSYAQILLEPKGILVNIFRWINHLFETKSVSTLILKIRN